MELITTTPPSPEVAALRNRLAHASGDAGMDLDPVAHMLLIEAYGELQQARQTAHQWPPPTDDDSQGFSPTQLRDLAAGLAALLDHEGSQSLHPQHVAMAARRVREAADLIATA